MKWLRRIIFSLLSTASIGAAGYFSFYLEQPNDAMTGIWLAFGLITFVFGWPEVAKSISFMGNSIELREVKEAITELKLLAKVFSRSTLEIMQAGNRWGGLIEDEKWQTYENIEKMLHGFGFKGREIEDIQSRWHYWVEGDYVRAIMWPESQIHHKAVPDSRSELWQQKLGGINGRVDKVTPDELRSIFTEVDGHNEEVKSVIDDYEFYIKNKKHRNLDRWKQRNKWFEK